MSNSEMFDLMVRNDLEKVQKMRAKGYTETSDFKVGLEMLLSSLEALLQDMDAKEQKYA